MSLLILLFFISSSVFVMSSFSLSVIRASVFHNKSLRCRVDNDALTRIHVCTVILEIKNDNLSVV